MTNDESMTKFENQKFFIIEFDSSFDISHSSLSYCPHFIASSIVMFAPSHSVAPILALM